jgi:hypothetical protein
MSGLGRRVGAERDLWQAVWKQVEAFLDRIDSLLGQDKPHVETMCALLRVFNVIESARRRSAGYRLAAALAAAPAGIAKNGATIAHVSASELTAGGRIPGVEDCEFAVAGYAVKDDGTLDEEPRSLMSRSITLARFRDAKHGEITLRTPTYDFGDLAGAAMIAIDIGDGGLFPKDAREKAISGEDFSFTSWAALRDERVAKAQEQADDTAVPLSTTLAKLLEDASPPSAAQLGGIAAQARLSANGCRADIQVLDSARQALVDAGVADDVVGALAAAAAALGQQASDFDSAANRLSPPTVNGLGHADLIAVVGLLQSAEGGLAPLALPIPLAVLDAACAKAMAEAVEIRIGYPDGPLRQLRMLQFSLRFFWEHRSRWMTWRHRLVLGPVYAAYMRPFVDSLQRVLGGQPSGIPLPANSKVGRATLTGATEIALSTVSDLSLLAAGQMVVVGGDRPAVAPVIDVLFDGKKFPPQRLKIPPLSVSTATGKNVPGTPGIIPSQTPLGDHHPALLDQELFRGVSRDGPAGDAYVQALVAHQSRLALVLGNPGVAPASRPAAPHLPAPYPSISRFDLDGTITAADNRLFLKSLPPAALSGTGEQLPIARPGEIMLLYGIDQEANAWQTAVEVDHAVVATGGEAKKDPALDASADQSATGTATTILCPCSGQGPPVMVVYLRSMQLPADVELGNAFLHRSFAGFGARSLMTGVMLPDALDGDTSSTVKVGPDLLQPRRDPELAAAVRVFDEWMPKELA